MVIVLGSVLYGQDGITNHDVTLSFRVYLNYDLVETDSVYVKLYTINNVYQNKGTPVKISNEFKTWVDSTMYHYLEFTHPGYNTVSFLIDPANVPSIINVFLEKDKPDVILGELKSQTIKNKKMFYYQKN